MYDIFVTPETFQEPILSLNVVEPLNMRDILITLLVSQLLTPLIVVIPQLLNIFVVAVIPTKSGVSVTPVNVKLAQP
jgi:hypothetical protein